MLLSQALRTHFSLVGALCRERPIDAAGLQGNIF